KPIRRYRAPYRLGGFRTGSAGVGTEPPGVDVVLADQLEEGAPVLARGPRCVGDIAMAAAQHHVQVAALEALDHARLGSLEGLDAAGLHARDVYCGAVEHGPL